MALSESELSIFPLTKLEFSYLDKFVQGKTPSILSTEGYHLRAASRASVHIRRKLAARTLAQGVWKAWDAGIDIVKPYAGNDSTVRPFMNSLSKKPQDILRMLAGGFHGLETDSKIGLSHTSRQEIISEMYSTLSARTHPELVYRAIQLGFFDNRKPIIFSETKRKKLRADDKLTDDQRQLLGLLAEGKRYAEIVEILSKKGISTSIQGVRPRLDGVRGKIARLSGKPTLPPYQTVLGAIDLGILDLSDYMATHDLHPDKIPKLPKPERTELDEAYERVLTSGLWVDRKIGKTPKARRLRTTYLSIGAQNPMQAVLMLHALKQPHERDSDIGQSLLISVPNGRSFMVTASELERLNQLDVNTLGESINSLPDNGFVPATVERSGGKALVLLADTLKGQLKSLDTESLTYRQLKDSYRLIEKVLQKYPDHQNAGNLLKFVNKRLRALQSNS